MLLPVRLRVEQDGHALFFEDPEEVINWLERRVAPENAD